MGSIVIRENSPEAHVSVHRLRLLLGFALEWAIFQIVGVPAILMHTKLSTLSGIVNLIYGVALVLALLLVLQKTTQTSEKHNRKIWANSKPTFLQTLYASCKDRTDRVLVNLLLGAVLFVIIYQILTVFFQQPVAYSDDYFYQPFMQELVGDNVTYTNTYFQTGLPVEGLQMSSKYIFSSYYQYLAMISAVSGVHTLIFTKTIYPVFMVAYYYLIWSVFGTWLFRKDEKKQLIFLLFVALASLYGGYSQYTIIKRLLLYVWNGKTGLAVFSLPFFFVYTNLWLNKPITKKSLIIIALLQITASMNSLMGFLLTPMMIVCLGIVKGIRDRKFSSLVKYVLTCLPAVICMIVMYVLNTKGIVIFS